MEIHVDNVKLESLQTSELTALNPRAKSTDEQSALKKARPKLALRKFWAENPRQSSVSPYIEIERNADRALNDRPDHASKEFYKNIALDYIEGGEIAEKMEDFVYAAKLYEKGALVFYEAEYMHFAEGYLEEAFNLCRQMQIEFKSSDKLLNCFEYQINKLRKELTLDPNDEFAQNGLADQLIRKASYFEKMNLNAKELYREAGDILIGMEDSSFDQYTSTHLLAYLCYEKVGSIDFSKKTKEDWPEILEILSEINQSDDRLDKFFYLVCLSQVMQTERFALLKAGDIEKFNYLCDFEIGLARQVIEDLFKDRDERFYGGEELQALMVDYVVLCETTARYCQESDAERAKAFSEEAEKMRSLMSKNDLEIDEKLIQDFVNKQLLLYSLDPSLTVYDIVNLIPKASVLHA